MIICEWFARDIAIMAGIKGQYLVTRNIGEAFASILLNRLTTIDSNSIVILSFENIQLVDGSFCDEVFGKLLVERALGKKQYPTILLRSLNEASLFNLDISLEYRRRQEGKTRTFAMPYIKTDGKTIALVGKVENHIDQTFALLVSKKCMTTRELSDILNIDLADASTRLKTLYAAGLVARIRSRSPEDRHFEYMLTIE